MQNIYVDKNGKMIKVYRVGKQSNNNTCEPNLASLVAQIKKCCIDNIITADTGTY